MVDRTVVLNPGFVTRGQDFQAYTKISVPSVSKLQSLEDGNLGEFVTVEVVKMDD